MTKTVDINEAQTQLSQLLALAQQGHEIIIAQDDKPMAKLTPCEAAHAGKRTPGLTRGEIWVSDDFDDPLPDEFWLGEDA